MNLSPQTAWLLAPLAALSLLGAGCSSTPLDETPPPSALEGLQLEDAGAPLSLAPEEPSFAPRRGHDAEGGFARRPATVAGPPSQGTRDRTSDAALAQLLDERPVLRGPVRLACLEVRGAREYVSVDCFGDQDFDQDHVGFWARSVPPAQLAVLRAALDRSSLPEPIQGWPEVEAAPTHPPFSAIVGVPSMLLPSGGSLRQLRLAAARVRAEAVLVLTRSTRVYRYHNSLANLYPLVIGLALPAREEVAVSRVEAALVSVRTGHVFAVATGEARYEETGWLLTRGREDSRQMAVAAEASATSAMTRDLSREIAQLEVEGRLIGPCHRAPRR
jgi:hypothetical protein